MGGEAERLLLPLTHKSQRRKRGNIDICGSREISDLAVVGKAWVVEVVGVVEVVRVD